MRIVSLMNKKRRRSAESRPAASRSYLYRRYANVYFARDNSVEPAEYSPTRNDRRTIASDVNLEETPRHRRCRPPPFFLREFELEHARPRISNAPICSLYSNKHVPRPRTRDRSAIVRRGRREPSEIEHSLIYRACIHHGGGRPFPFALKMKRRIRFHR